ncbi:DUF2147 domain-containing protein [Spirosoma taeanense]|uniref:DUF2147 domain-containing protein n=1 Tax=Spirosoma taeanense TaxID=2735870 RepID=A0A6M5YC90_9BACT|nr:DUF2147 domain-containing protein [Spirosoma taeanense]QJW90522.1 DUF2147 domain-containing protein [Spirosoma taeanense]
MNKFRLVAILLLFSITLSSATEPNDPDAIVGRWLSARKRNQVQIYKHGNRYFGKLVWMKEPTYAASNKPRMDDNNPDEKLRTRPLLNLMIMSNLDFKGGNVWNDGQIYNPEDGKTYGCEVTLKDPNTLDVRGYVLGIPFLGKTQSWTRVR